MVTMMARGAMTTIDRRRLGAARPSHLPVTLYDLITAIQDVVGLEEDQLVVATMRHLLWSGRLKGAWAQNLSMPTAAPGDGVVAHDDRRG
jgi:hypothetical protein